MSQPSWPPHTAPSTDDACALAGLKSRTRRTRRECPVSSGQIRSGLGDTPPIIAICHLGWDWVWQRPQQFLSRLSQRHRVLFVETYCSAVETTKVSIRKAPEHVNVVLLRMELPASRWSDGEFIDAERRRALQAVLARDLRGDFERPLLWFYDPMAVVAFAGHLGEQAIIYDCMDELSQFRGAPPELVVRERELLARADLVFCGGQKMRRKRLPLNPDTHFFGTGVDCSHFGAALADDLPVSPEIASLGPGRVLGYFGVVDERIDYELLAKLADASADWHVVMVGPTAKVNRADFPRRPNLHWLGSRPYADLPSLTKGFSVALMPFALNPATEFINPTKALEYMAAGRPIVSTALDEVRLNFGRVARIAESHEEFITLCRREASRPSHSRIERGLRQAAANTWDAIVGRMEQLIAEMLSTVRSVERFESNSPAAPAPITKLAYV